MCAPPGNLELASSLTEDMNQSNSSCQTAGYALRMDQFHFGNSTLDHLARSCWGTKRGGGVYRASVWMGLCAFAMPQSSSKQWQQVKVWMCMTCSYTWAAVRHPPAGAPTCQPSRCSLQTIFQEEQVPPTAHPATPLLQDLIPFLVLQACGNISF